MNYVFSTIKKAHLINSDIKLNKYCDYFFSITVASDVDLPLADIFVL